MGAQKIHAQFDTTLRTVLNQKREEEASLQQVFGQELESLRKELARYVKADEPPSKNERYRRTIDLIQKTEKRKFDQQHQIDLRSDIQQRMGAIGSKLAALLREETAV